MMEGDAPFDPDIVIPTNSQILILSFKAELERRQVPEPWQLPLVAAFLYSEAPKRAPFLRIACGLFAAMAVEASRGQAPNPDAGMMTDVDTAATLLPYCDAAVFDDRCVRLLKTATEEAQLEYKAQVFSNRTRDGLLEWLDAVEAAASPEHLELIEQVYGARGLEPYVTMFETEPSPREAGT
jgi:hypothetical protein